jgi:TPR repeat protein
VTWHRKAAALGYAPAATSLALALGHGRGVEKAEWGGEAVQLLQQAADAGHVPAMLHLSSCLNRHGGYWKRALA